MLVCKPNRGRELCFRCRSNRRFFFDATFYWINRSRYKYSHIVMAVWLLSFYISSLNALNCIGQRERERGKYAHMARFSISPTSIAIFSIRRSIRLIVCSRALVECEMLCTSDAKCFLFRHDMIHSLLYRETTTCGWVCVATCNHVHVHLVHTYRYI